jgi:hypothetical protein
MDILFKLLFLPAGLLLLTGGLWWSAARWRLLRDGTTVQATIVDYQVTRDFDGQTRFFHPMLRIGDHAPVRCRSGSSARRWQVGDRIRVRLPADGEVADALPDRLTDLWLIPLVMTAMGAGCIAMALF